MISLEEYLRDPCGTLSIPYWKSRSIRIPPHMKIVHARDFDPGLYRDYTDEPYFRLYHPLTETGAAPASGFSLRTASADDLPLMADIINRSYTDLSVTVHQLKEYTAAPVYRPELWLVALDGQGAAAGCAIAELDAQAREGAVEWVQVLPQYRRQGVGQLLVGELLRGLSSMAGFATVSGRADNPSRPELLYRKCGFTGEDVWHILTRKAGAGPVQR